MRVSTPNHFILSLLHHFNIILNGCPQITRIPLAVCGATAVRDCRSPVDTKQMVVGTYGQNIRIHCDPPSGPFDNISI